MEILIATKNSGKVKEIEQFCKNLQVVLRNLLEFPEINEIEETGSTYEENAILKARNYSLATNLWSLADDSGLEVEVLGNAPGVFSARYGGENSTNEEKIHKILEELDESGESNRNARFVSVMALTNEKGEVLIVAKGVCDGTISNKPFGSNGFGYDPIFIPKNYRKTFGELDSETKQRISHRTKSIKKIIDFLRDST